MMFYALALFNVFVATVAQMLLKKAAITPHKSFLKEYLNPWVIGGYSLMVFSLVSNVYVLSQGVLLKELGTFFVHPSLTPSFAMTSTLPCTMTFCRQELHAEEFVRFFADKVYFFGFQAKEHRQAQQAIAFAGSVFIFAAKAAIAQARRRAMQRHIVEHS